MIQAGIETHKTMVLALVAALTLTSGITLAKEVPTGLSTEYIHAPKFSEGERLVVRSHFSSAATTAPEKSQESQQGQQAGSDRRALPRELMIVLPRRDGRFMRLLVEDDVILLDRLTGVILDVIPNVSSLSDETTCDEPVA